jgi:methyl-accepting chemotaxis protein
VVLNALLERPAVSVVKREGVLAPQIFIEAAVPIEGSDVLGAALTGFIVDDAFVDRVKEITGLDVSVFGGNERSATTFLAADGKSRELGTLEADPKINRTVLVRGEIYVGESTISNQLYFTSYLPLENVHEEVVGMLFVGTPQTTILDTAQRTFQLTFMLSSALMALSLIPSYFISRYIHSQIA